MGLLSFLFREIPSESQSLSISLLRGIVPGMGRFEIDENKLRSVLPPPTSLPSEDWYVMKRALGIGFLLLIIVGLVVLEFGSLFTTGKLF